MILNQSQLKLIDINSTDYSEVWTHASGTESSTQLPLKLTGFPLILGNKSQINDFHHSASRGESEVTLYNRAISRDFGIWHLLWVVFPSQHSGERRRNSTERATRLKSCADPSLSPTTTTPPI